MFATNACTYVRTYVHEYIHMHIQMHMHMHMHMPMHLHLHLHIHIHIHTNIYIYGIYVLLCPICVSLQRHHYPRMLYGEIGWNCRRSARKKIDSPWQPSGGSECKDEIAPVSTKRLIPVTLFASTNKYLHHLSLPGYRLSQFETCRYFLTLTYTR